MTQIKDLTDNQIYTLIRIENVSNKIFGFDIRYIVQDGTEEKQILLKNAVII